MNEEEDSVEQTYEVPNVITGDALRSLGEDKIGGVLVRLTSNPRETDTYGTYFDEETDFGFERGDSIRTATYFEHALADGELKERIGDGVVSYKTAGELRALYGDLKSLRGLDEEQLLIWVESQLDRRHSYYKGIKQLVEEGALSWSSGTAPNLIRVENVGGSMRVTRWPLGLDASLTPTPGEFRESNTVVSLRALFEQVGRDRQEKEVMSETTTPNTPAEQPAPAAPAAVRADEQILVSPPGMNVDALAAALSPMISEAVRSEVARVAAPQQPIVTEEYQVPQNVRVNSVTGFGDNEIKAMAYYYRTGDARGAGLANAFMSPEEIASMRASNDTDMNITTAADGGNAVPTGHYQGIIARRDPGMLAAKFDIMPIPGTGTTVNAPRDDEADGEFVLTSEASASDRDAPAIGQKALTLALYTKKIELSFELLQDEDSKLLAFLENFVGRGLAKTHNNLLVTEVETNGTEFTEFASATAIAAGEPEDVIQNDDLGAYLDDSGSVGWAMRSSTHWTIKSITGSDRLYAGAHGSNPKELLGYPVAYTNKAGLMTADLKPVLFGNWNYVGFREAPGLTVIRDPYTGAATGQLVLHYYFRAVYGVLQAEAIGYGSMATA